MYCIPKNANALKTHIFKKSKVREGYILYEAFSASFLQIHIHITRYFDETFY